MATHTDENTIHPSDENELAELLAQMSCIRRGVKIAGGGTRSLMLASGLETTISVRRMAGVVAYDPGELTMIARAGTPLAEIEAILATEGQMLTFEPVDPRPVHGSDGEPTIGGTVATNSSGPRRVLGGACRDHLLGVRFADGRGRILKNGGRVMKNVTGLDLAKPLCGSHGTLGVLTEVAIKTLPAPERQITLAFSRLNALEAVELFSAVLATPYEVSGAAYHAGVAWIRIEGLASQVRYRCDRLTALLGNREHQVIEDVDSRALWRRIRDVEHFSRSGTPLWKILVKATSAPKVTGILKTLGGDFSLDWGGGLIWYAGDADGARVRAAASPGGAILIRRGLGQTDRMFPRELEAVASITSALRRTFDPARILNRDLMGE